MKSITLKYGFLGGVAVVFYFFAVYFAGKQQFLNPTVQWASMVIYLACMFKAAKDDCALHGTARDFREITRTPFAVFILINLGYWLFFYGLHLADPELLQMETELQLAHLRSELAAGLGDPEQANQVRDQIQTLEKEGMGITLGSVLQRMATGAIGGFALAAGIAAYFKFSD